MKKIHLIQFVFFCILLYGCISNKKDKMRVKESDCFSEIYNITTFTSNENTLSEIQVSNPTSGLKSREFSQCYYEKISDSTLLHLKFGFMNGNTLSVLLHEDKFSTSLKNWGDSSGESYTFDTKCQSFSLNNANDSLNAYIDYVGFVDLANYIPEDIKGKAPFTVTASLSGVFSCKLKSSD